MSWLLNAWCDYFKARHGSDSRAKDLPHVYVDRGELCRKAAGESLDNPRKYEMENMLIFIVILYFKIIIISGLLRG